MFAPNNAAWAAFESMLNAKDPRLTAVANQIIALVRGLGGKRKAAEG